MASRSPIPMRQLRRGSIQFKAGLNYPALTRRFGTSTRRLDHEYFVRIWNAEGMHSQPSRIRHCLSTLAVSFEGSMLRYEKEGEEKTIGTCFACRSASAEAIKNALKHHPYAKDKTWNVDKVEITALETVHSGDFEREEASLKH